MSEEMKVCTNSECEHGGKPQPLSNFYRCKKLKDGYRYECKDCTNKYYKALRERNPEYRKRQNQYQTVRYNNDPEYKERKKMYKRIYMRTYGYGEDQCNG